MLNKLANLFGVSVDDILNPDKEAPKEITVEDKTTLEQGGFFVLQNKGN